MNLLTILFSLFPKKLLMRMVLEVATNLAKRTDNDIDDEIVRIIKSVLESEYQVKM